MVGLFDDNEYETRELTLEEGDTLLLYTDGVTEASRSIEGNSEMYGEERLLDNFTSLRGANSRDIIHTIIGTVYEYTEYGDQEDDITLICIRRGNPHGEP